MKYLYLLIVGAAVALSACEEKKSLDGHSMEKPPPSAFMERDSAPDMDKLDDAASSAEKQ
ncbi:MAG: hypothetical protein IT526_05550 [Nitrosomonas sp.]|uniref:hypothetical protein n=1 Tax=Nitrosomonas sp. TaxID=42353 RepID=UPI002567142D|nr:hypothetical protein [Nitrosomonas sp.]MBE7526972.1 hypothetical protein [Burkholderiales bacterium]MCC6161699.1 hypothetical protein [Nitrosomonas sp.]MDL1866856.1 hypothetical protein [Betaproteobacteria bacterium PRO4]